MSDAPPARRKRAERGAPAGRDAELDDAQQALFDRLRAIRLEIARREQIAAYMVFADRTLIEMASQRPATLAALRQIHGVGDAKLARYGAAFVEAIR